MAITSQQPNSTIGFDDLNKRKPQGTGYTNIQRLVQANTQNKLGSTIGGNIQKSGQQVQQGLQQGQQQFQQGTQQEVGRIQPEVQNLTQQVLADPTKAADSQQGQQFTGLLQGNYAGGAYRGPQGLQNAQQLRGQAQDVYQQARALGSAAGRQGLLQRYVGTPQYTAGQGKLDSLLLGQTGGKALSEARRGALGLMGQAQSQIGGAEAQAQEAQSRFNQLLGQGREQALQQLGQQVTGLTGDLSQRAQQAQTSADERYQALLNASKTGELTQEQADILGVKEGDQLFNLFKDNPDAFIRAGEKATSQGIASPEEYARIQALNKLSGGAATGESADALRNFLSQARSEYNPNQYALTDKQALQNQILAAQNQYGADKNALYMQHYNTIEPLRKNESGGLTFGNVSQALGDNSAVREAMEQTGFQPGESNTPDQILKTADVLSQNLNQKLAALQPGQPIQVNGQIINPNDMNYQAYFNQQKSGLEEGLRRLSALNPLRNAVTAEQQAQQGLQESSGYNQKVRII